MFNIRNTSLNHILYHLNIGRQEGEILDELPIFETLPSGKTFLILSKASVADVKDVTHDGLNPWSGTDLFGKRTTTKTSSYGINSNEAGFFQESETSAFQLRILRNVHPHYAKLKREIFYVLDDSGCLQSNVFYIYQAELDLILEQPCNNNHLLPSERKVLKDALTHRTTIGAKEFLRDKGVNVSVAKLSSLSRTVQDHVKTNIGRKAPADFHSIFDRYVLKPNVEELLENPVIEMDEGSLRIRIIVGFPDAFQCFGASLPNKEDLDQHRASIDSMEQMLPNERKSFISSYLSSTTESGSLPMIGSCLMIDTTFCLSSAEYVTLALGITDTFKSKKSKKNSSLILGYMIHSRKDMIEHESFASFLNTNFLKHCSSKAIGLIVHDGEAAFSAYSTGEFLRNLSLIRCDVHRLQNLKDVVKKDKDYDFELVKAKLFGNKVKTDKGVMLKQGILNSTSRAEYDMQMIDYIEQCDGQLKIWLLTNFNSLYNHNSFVMKLRGGWPLQYLTSNIIEAKNSYLKLMITTKKPAQKILNDFLRIHKQEIEERIAAVGSRSQHIHTDFALPSDEWMSKSRSQQRLALATFGLRNTLPVFLFEDLPSWVKPSRIPDESLNEAIQDLHVHQSQSSPDNFFLSNSKKFDDCSRVILNGNSLSCYSHACKRKMKLKFCVHTLVVALSLDYNLRSDIIRGMQEKRENVTCNDELRHQMRPEQGTKFLKRRGKQYSQNNSSRNFVGLMDSTLSSLDETIE